MVPAVRTASPAELPLLAEVELAADEVFAPLGIVFPPATPVGDVAAPEDVLVAGDPPVAFAYAGWLDDHLHLHQIAVHPRHARRGIGSALMAAVISRAGAAGVTLTTFRDVPWNAPWYARLGFTELTAPGPALAGLVAREQAELAGLGHRLVMYRPGA